MKKASFFYLIIIFLISSLGVIIGHIAYAQECVDVPGKKKPQVRCSDGQKASCSDSDFKPKCKQGQPVCCKKRDDGKWKCKEDISLICENGQSEDDEDDSSDESLLQVGDAPNEQTTNDTPNADETITTQPESGLSADEKNSLQEGFLGAQKDPIIVEQGDNSTATITSIEATTVPAPYPTPAPTPEPNPSNELTCPEGTHLSGSECVSNTTPTPEPTPAPAPTPTPEPTPTPAPTPAPEPTPTPAPTPTPEPTPTPAPTPAPAPTPTQGQTSPSAVLNILSCGQSAPTCGGTCTGGQTCSSFYDNGERKCRCKSPEPSSESYRAEYDNYAPSLQPSISFPPVSSQHIPIPPQTEPSPQPLPTELIPQPTPTPVTTPTPSNTQPVVAQPTHNPTPQPTPTTAGSAAIDNEHPHEIENTPQEAQENHEQGINVGLSDLLDPKPTLCEESQAPACGGTCLDNGFHCTNINGHCGCTPNPPPQTTPTPVTTPTPSNTQPTPNPVPTPGNGSSSSSGGFAQPTTTSRPTSTYDQGEGFVHPREVENVPPTTTSRPTSTYDQGEGFVHPREVENAPQEAQENHEQGINVGLSDLLDPKPTLCEESQAPACGGTCLDNGFHCTNINGHCGCTPNPPPQTTPTPVTTPTPSNTQPVVAQPTHNPTPQPTPTTAGSAAIDNEHPHEIENAPQEAQENHEQGINVGLSDLLELDPKPTLCEESQAPACGGRCLDANFICVNMDGHCGCECSCRNQSYQLRMGETKCDIDGQVILGCAMDGASGNNCYLGEWDYCIPGNNEVCEDIPNSNPRRAHCVQATPPPQPTPPNCGNSIIETPETCDDGNVVSGDGCSSSCNIESTQQPTSNSQPSPTISQPTPSGNCSWWSNGTEWVSGDTWNPPSGVHAPSTCTESCNICSRPTFNAGNVGEHTSTPCECPATTSKPLP